MPLALDFTSTLVMGVHLAGRHHALGQVAFFHFGQLGGINLGAAARRREHSARDQEHEYCRQRCPR